MDIDMSGTPHVDKAPTIRLFAALLVLSLSYTGVFFFLYLKSTNFIDAQALRKAQQWAEANRITIPTTISFGKDLPTNASLAAGWNSPEDWGVWGSSSKGNIILPAPSTNKGAEICLKLSIGALDMSNRQSWRLQVFVDNRAVTENEPHSGPGPYDIVTMPFIPKGSAMDIVLVGPMPQTPKATGVSNDARFLSFNLRSILVTDACH